MASKAVGMVHGVSKQSTPVVIKTSHSMADNEWAFASAYDHILRNNRQDVSVILYARSSVETYTLDSQLPEHWDGIKELMFKLLEKKIKIVKSAGNEGAVSPHVNTVPAIWAKIMPLFLVGGVTLTGAKSPLTQTISAEGVTMLWAPGEQVECANGLNPAGQKTVSGTSAAAGMVILLSVINVDGPC